MDFSARLYINVQYALYTSNFMTHYVHNAFTHAYLLHKWANRKMFREFITIISCPIFLIDILLGTKVPLFYGFQLNFGETKNSMLMTYTLQKFFQQKKCASTSLPTSASSEIFCFTMNFGTLKNRGKSRYFIIKLTPELVAKSASTLVTTDHLLQIVSSDTS